MIKNYKTFAANQVACTRDLYKALNELPISFTGFLTMICVTVGFVLSVTPIIPVHRLGVMIQEESYVSAFAYFNRKRGE